MCSMCPRLGFPEPPPGKHLPWAGDPDCDFIDWSEDHPEWIVENSNDPSDMCEFRGEPVELGESVWEEDENWDRYSDDAAVWPIPDEWAVDREGELPEWLIEIEGFDVRPYTDDDEEVVLAPQEELALAT